jgi:hypothetical protein
LKTPVGTFLAVLDLGGRLSPADGEKLHKALPPDCPSGLKEAIHTHKAALRELFASSNFVVVRSDVLLPPLLIWTATDRDRDRLMAHGAQSEIVYTRDELAVITRANPDPRALAAMHRVKELFGGRFTAPSVQLAA